MNDFQKTLEEFRNHYKVRYDVELDDVTLYFFIRVNEMQKDLKAEIANIPRIHFRTGWDYFLYGLGSCIHWILAILIFLLVVALMFAIRIQ